MSARAEQLVLEYLSRVADEARGVLRSEERLRFVSRIRASIDQQRDGAPELDETRRVLATFGDPEVLVQRERRRLDEAVQRANAKETAGASSPASPAASVPPASPADPAASVSPASPADPAASAVPATSPAPTSWAPAAPAGSPALVTPAADGPPARNRAAEQRRVRDRAADQPSVRGPVPGKGAMPRPPAPSAAGASATVHGYASGRLRTWRPPGRRSRFSRQRSSGSAPHTAFDLLSTTRRFRVAALAVILLGLGGVLLPFPLWLIGAAIAMTSWAWNRPEKLIGLAGPLIVVVAGVGVAGALNKNPSMPVDPHAYLAAAHAHGRVLMGAGAVAGALFLGARLLRRYRAVVRRSANR